MKTVYLLTLVLLAIYTCHAQDTIICYFDEQLSLTDKRNAVFNGKMTEVNESWEVFALYPGGNVLLHAFFKDKKLKIRDGGYTIFYPNGNRKAFTAFKDNIADTSFISWHENGQLSDSGLLQQQIKTGLWKTWYVTGQQESEGNYLNGAYNGVWHWYHPGGQPATIETYSNGKISDLTCFDTSGKASGFNCRIEKKPCPENAKSFEAYVTENLFYPKTAIKKKIEGDIVFEFFITQEGKLTKINFANEGNPVLQEEVVRLLKSVQVWEPAVSHNRAIPYLYEYSVPFYLPGNEDQ